MKIADLFEPMAQQLGHEMPDAPAEKVAAVSIAISLKRIADALDAISNGAAINVNNSY